MTTAVLGTKTGVSVPSFAGSSGMGSTLGSVGAGKYSFDWIESSVFKRDKLSSFLLCQGICMMYVWFMVIKFS